MKRWIPLMVQLFLVPFLVQHAEAAYTITQPANIVAGKQFTVSWTVTTLCPTCSIGVFDVRDNSSPLFQEEVRLTDSTGTAQASGSVTFVIPLPYIGQSAIKVMMRGPGLPTPLPQTLAFNVAVNPYMAGWPSFDANWYTTKTNFTETLSWTAPGTTHAGDLITLALTNSAAGAYQVSVPVPDGSSSGTVLLTALTKGFPYEYRYVRGGTIEYRGQPLTVLQGSGPPPPPPAITCTVTLLSGSPTVGSVVTGTVVSCL